MFTECDKRWMSICLQSIWELEQRGWSWLPTAFNLATAHGLVLRPVLRKGIFPDDVIIGQHGQAQVEATGRP